MSGSGKRELRVSDRSEHLGRKSADRKDKPKSTRVKKEVKKDKEKGKRTRRRKEEKAVDDTRSELSYGLPDTDLSKSKATKRAFSSKCTFSLCSSENRLSSILLLHPQHRPQIRRCSSPSSSNV